MGNNNFNKKLISIRINADLLSKVDSLRDSRNMDALVSYGHPKRNYYLSLYGYTSRSDIIESALIDFFNNLSKETK